ncbi:hypothetical protein FRC20_003645 [Serendipita sp. 405]|nr:hypothetical protein FRC20_003645 [Serendipita sp. 405]
MSPNPRPGTGTSWKRDHEGEIKAHPTPLSLLSPLSPLSFQSYGVRDWDGNRQEGYCPCCSQMGGRWAYFQIAMRLVVTQLCTVAIDLGPTTDEDIDDNCQ